MIAIILGFLKNHWLGTIAGALILATATKLSLQQLEIKHLHSEVAFYSAENITLNASNKALVTSVEKQNTAISLLQDESNKKMKEASKALVTAKAHARKYSAVADRIEAEQITGEECANMRTILNKYFGTLQ